MSRASFRLAVRDNIGRLVFAAALILILSAMVHISALLLLPRLATQDAYHRLLRDNPETQMRLIAGENPPFQRTDPAVVMAACPFHLGAGPLRVRTKPEPQEFLSIAFHAPDGTAFFAVTDKAANKDEISILLVTQEQLRLIESEDDPEDTIQELRLVSPVNDGFVVVRSLVQRPSERQLAEQRIMSVTCENDKSEMPDQETVN